jgi:uncharacterized cupredoxin-like copper-binding protein
LKDIEMNASLKPALLLLAALGSATWVLPANAAVTTVKISLWDKGPDAADIPDKMPMMGAGMADAGMAGMANLGIKLDKTSVPAGKVTFDVANASKDLIHEMVVSPLADIKKPLPYDNDAMKINEDTAGHLGEVSELDPGKAGSLTLDLKPGEYLLYCNLPGHEAMGMWAQLTVTQ